MFFSESNNWLAGEDEQANPAGGSNFWQQEPAAPAADDRPEESIEDFLYGSSSAAPEAGQDQPSAPAAVSHQEHYLAQQEKKAQALLGQQKLFQSPAAGAALGFGGLQSASPMQNQFAMPHVPAWQQEANRRGFEEEGEDPFFNQGAAGADIHLAPSGPAALQPHKIDFEDPAAAAAPAPPAPAPVAPPAPQPVKQEIIKEEVVVQKQPPSTSVKISYAPPQSSSHFEIEDADQEEAAPPPPPAPPAIPEIETTIADSSDAYTGNVVEVVSAPVAAATVAGASIAKAAPPAYPQQVKSAAGGMPSHMEGPPRGVLSQEEEESDQQEEAEELHRAGTTMVSSKGGKGGDDDSDEEGGGGAVMVLKQPKSAGKGAVQNEGSLFIKKLNYDVTSQEEMMELLMQPVPKEAGTVLCTIKRDKSGFNRWHPRYELMLSGTFRFLMNGKKRPHNRTSNYLITTETKKLKKKQQGTLGKLRSNFLGTEFQVFDSGENPKKKVAQHKIRKQLGVVMYETNVLGSRGPRKMKVLLPAIDSHGRRALWRPMNDKEGMVQSYKAGERELIMSFINKPPEWKEQLQAYVLNFNGRVEKASVKNFQLVDKQEPDVVLMQFGRVSKHEFSMDVQWPLSLFQAFSICLSSFDFKFACE